MQNKLNGLRAYLSGPMEFADDSGTKWRDQITPFLKDMGIIVLDPTKTTHQGKSESDLHKEIQHLKKAEEWHKLSEMFKPIRNFDLRLVDVCDFMIVLIDQDIPMCGTWEELFLANREKKPILLVWQGGKSMVSSWMFATIDPSYIFADFDSLKERLISLNNDEYPMDDRWVLVNDHGIHVRPENAPKKPERAPEIDNSERLPGTEYISSKF